MRPYALVIALLLSACDQSPQQIDNEKIKQLTLRIETLEARYLQLKDSVPTDIQKRLEVVENLQFKQVMAADGSVTLSPEAEGYGIAKTSYGPILIDLIKVEPYANGFIASIKLGNLSSAVLSQLKINYKWRKPSNEMVEQSKSIVSLQPGSWTNMQLKIMPATIEDIKYLVFNIDTSESAVNLRVFR